MNMISFTIEVLGLLFLIIGLTQESIVGIIGNIILVLLGIIIYILGRAGSSYFNLEINQ